MSKPAILVLALSNLATDPRVHRQLRLLQADHRVTAAGFVDPAIPGIEFIALPSRAKSPAGRLGSALRLKLRRFESYYWSIDSVQAALAALRGRAFDLILANDPNTWPLAFALRGAGRVLLDAHEYAPRELEDLAAWRFFHQGYQTWLCRRYLPQADAVTTVCAGIAAEYARHFGVQPVVVMNAAPRRTAEPVPVPPDRIRMIHHGGAIRSRRIETMISALDHLDERFSLDLMLVETDAAYAAELRDLARAQPRVRFRPPVPMARIPEETRDYEVGLFLLEPVNFNYRHALPNKFFEFIQSRLVVAVGPSPEMAPLVRQFDCGVVSADFSPASLARTLEDLTPARIAHYKQQAHRAADVLCWEHEGETLRRLVQQLLAAPPRAA